MPSENLTPLRQVLASLSTDHDADGEHKPRVGEVFAPEQHASALAPSTLIVVGARGAGKSFWAGVLGQEDTRTLAASVYPRLGLENLIVKSGYNGFDTDTAVDRKTIEARVPVNDSEEAIFFWQIIILRCALSGLGNPEGELSIGELMKKYKDPEDLGIALKRADSNFEKKLKTLLVTFDALDTLSRDWGRLTALTDALFEAVWLLRARRHIRAKVFIRPDQLNDEALTFVEMPKLRSGRVELTWSRSNLYGLLFNRLAEAEADAKGYTFKAIAAAEGFSIPKDTTTRLRDWELAWDEGAQKSLMERFVGLYMGRGANKGSTYPWAYNHLADAKGIVTPRSFLKLFVEAAQHTQINVGYMLTPEGIRHGLREASKTRVEQLALEYRWIKRALAPLAGLKVPCPRYDLHELWELSDTVKVITDAAVSEGFLPPYRTNAGGTPEEALEASMERIGIISYRPDGRADIPDLFRIAARMFKLGGVALKAKM